MSNTPSIENKSEFRVFRVSHPVRVSPMMMMMIDMFRVMTVMLNSALSAKVDAVSQEVISCRYPKDYHHFPLSSICLLKSSFGFSWKVGSLMTCLVA